MTDNVHNLDDQQPEDFFRFQLNGKIYQMKYPTMEEIQKAQKLSDQEKVEWIYEFITAEDKDTPPIKEALAKKNVKFLQAFNNMVATQFGA